MLIIEGLITEFRWFTVIHMESRGDSIFITANHWNEVLNPFLPLFTPCPLFLPLSHSYFSALRSKVLSGVSDESCACTFSRKDNASLCTCTWVRSLKKISSMPISFSFVLKNIMNATLSSKLYEQ